MDTENYKHQFSQDHLMVDEQTPFEILASKEDLQDLNRNDFRESSLIYLRIITLAIEYITTAQHPLIASYGVSYALGIAPQGISQRALAKQLGISTGTISVHVNAFKSLANLD